MTFDDRLKKIPPRYFDTLQVHNLKTYLQSYRINSDYHESNIINHKSYKKKSCSLFGLSIVLLNGPSIVYSL